MAVFRAKPHAIEAIFGRRRAVIGVIHLPGLPGAPDYDGASMDSWRRRSVANRPASEG